MTKNLYEVEDPRGKTITLSRGSYYGHNIVGKHWNVSLDDMKNALKDPDFIYRSSQTPIRDVYFKRNTSSSYSKKLYTKVVAEYSLRNEAEIVTAFPHKKVKGGIEDEPIYEK